MGVPPMRDGLSMSGTLMPLNMQKNVKILLIAMWTIAFLAVGGVTAGVWWYRLTQRTDQPRVATIGPQNDSHHLDILFDAPAFVLTDQDGQPFDSKELNGKVWVADFVFTSCSGMCPLMTEQLREFQNKTNGINMVSFSVDPETDTPAVLKDYANKNKADLSRWHFLTGSKETMWNISNGMKLAVGPGDDHQIMHSSHFLLVDQSGHVRGIYDYKRAGFMNDLIADAKTLASEK
jgi:protein SCO1/2